MHLWIWSETEPYGHFFSIDQKGGTDLPQNQPCKRAKKDFMCPYKITLETLLHQVTSLLLWVVYGLVARARGLKYEFKSRSTWSRRPNFVRKRGHAKGKSDCLKLSHIWLCLRSCSHGEKKENYFHFSSSFCHFSPISCFCFS